MMPPSRLDCPLSLETAHMGNPGKVYPQPTTGVAIQFVVLRAEGLQQG